MNPPAARSTYESSGSSIVDWLQLHLREVVIGLVVLVALVLGWVVYQRTAAANERRAERAYFGAQQALSMGDPAAAESTLARVVDVHDGTVGGTQAAIQLAQVRFEQGKIDEGLATLRRVEGQRAAREFGAVIAALKGAGLESRGSYAEAATEYRRAAERARFRMIRLGYRADEARALTLAGSAAEAATIWEELAEDPTSPIAAEARVRLGELRAAAAPRG